MAKLQKKDVLHVAKLSNLTLTPNQVVKFKAQLEGIISYIDNLREVETKNIEPTSQTTGLKSVLRDDQIDETITLSVEDATSEGKKITNDLFEVPMILSERSDK